MRIGSLFSGYGGLDLAVKALYPDATTAWVSDNDKGAAKILAHRFPDAPNLGDITKVDWTQVEPVDVMTAGFPCQPVSTAGKGLGLADERWLFGEIVRALSELDTRPRLLVLENVPRLRTLDRGNVMAAVVHGLASVGYVGRYFLLRASDVGATHQRERIFFAAHPAGDPWGVEYGDDGDAAHPAGQRHEWGGVTRGRWPGPTDGSLLPTPRATDGPKGGPNQAGSSGDLMLPSAVQAGRFGEYAAAIARQEQAFGHPAPDPTEPTAKGTRRLSCRFDEWMMGLPPGWITDTPGITHHETLKACGNGVVPQQAEAALRWLLAVTA